MIAFVIRNSNLVPLLESLCTSNPCRFEFSVFGTAVRPGMCHRQGTPKELDSRDSRNTKQGEQLDRRKHPVRSNMMHPTRGSITIWAPPLPTKATVTALSILVEVLMALPTAGGRRPTGVAMALLGARSTPRQAVKPRSPSRRSRQTTPPAPTTPVTGVVAVLLLTSREQTIQVINTAT